MTESFQTHISFSSSHDELNAGFAWAKAQALAYAHFGGDPVGLWYEAALPERDAFCMRDTAHQCFGAAALGLSPHNKNMFTKFVQNISESRDFCTYWEIDKRDKPAPVDYTCDTDFWYNLPANFDVIRACWAQYLWTGDQDYLTHKDFARFYQLSANDYIKRWDKNNDGIPEYDPQYGRRGLASYDEVPPYSKMGTDLPAIMYSAYRALAKIAEETGRSADANNYNKRAEQLQNWFFANCIDAATGLPFSHLQHDGRFTIDLLTDTGSMLAYFSILEHNSLQPLSAVLQRTVDIGAPNVELMSYLPEVLFRYGRVEDGFRVLLALMSPQLERRDYPEVSYAAVGVVVQQLMGISANGKDTIRTFAHLPKSVDWVSVNDLPILGGTIHVKHEGMNKTVFTNNGKTPLRWQAAFENAVTEDKVFSQELVKSGETKTVELH